MAETVDWKFIVPRSNIIQGADAGWINYDASGLTWSFRYARPPGGFSLLSRLLTHPLFDSMQEVAITWTVGPPYQLSELREAYLRGIEHDDGWLTRFVEEEALKRRVRACQTFEELVLAWRSMETEREE